MSGSTKFKSLHVVHGAGVGDGRRLGRLAALGAPRPVVPRQMGLASVPARASTIISLGMNGLSFESFQRQIRVHGVRRIVDIRLLPAFRGRGFEVGRVFEVFASMNIEYERMAELGNRFLGESLNEHVVFQKLLTYLRGCQESLQKLRADLNRGPVLLLGRAPTHIGSERDAVVRILEEVGAEFDVIVADGACALNDEDTVGPCGTPSAAATARVVLKTGSSGKRKPGRPSVQRKLRFEPD